MDANARGGPPFKVEFPGQLWYPLMRWLALESWVLDEDPNDADVFKVIPRDWLVRRDGRPDAESGQASITCWACGMTSHHPADVAEGYCGNCHAWTGVGKHSQ